LKPFDLDDFQQKPKVFLTLDELARNNPYHVDDSGITVTPPLFMSDVQQLLMFSVTNVHSSFRPRYVLNKQLV